MKEENKQTMKPAYIENILMWMTIFIGFIWMFFFVIDYATAIRIKDNIDALSEYGARLASETIDQTTIDTDATFITNLNNIRIKKISNLNTSNLVCTIATTTPQSTNYQVIFVTKGTYLDGFLSNQGTDNFTSTKVVFNENSPAQLTCTLSITIN